MKIKKLFSLIMVICSLTLMLPHQEAKAGFAIVGTGAVIQVAQGDPPFCDLLILALGIDSVFLGGVVGGITMIFAPTIGKNILFASIILNADGSLSESQLAQSLAANYNFIDNQQVIAELAATIKNKFEMNRDSEDSAYITLEHAETKEILSSSDLTEDQVMIVANDLK